ncbi:MAG: GDSL-type esterase/lipase family protein [Candidatus Sumerlaeota bacterium]|nr:GDSL-type esterase/lipase family protein [Candidatus Sumerlaeota bacterium]
MHELCFNAMRALLIVFVLSMAPLLCAADKPASASATDATTSTAAKSPHEKWEKDIKAYEDADKKSAPPEGAILFIGSSSIRLWKTLAQDFSEYKVINRGFGGSEIADSTYFADRIIIPYKPKLIILGAGSNDIHAKKTPEQVADNFKAFVEKVRGGLPDVRIAYLSINPAPSRAAEIEKAKKANQLIKDYISAGKNLDYINIFDCYLDADGKPREDLYGSDRLHHNPEGYKVRAAIVKSYLDKVAKPTEAK